jgi:exodeoxyribonuclease V alpha subunit
MSETIIGRVTHAYPRKYNNRMFVIYSPTHQRVTCVGDISDNHLIIGSRISVTGEFKKRGNWTNFVFDDYELHLPKYDVEGIKTFLIKHVDSIGVNKAQQIIEVVGQGDDEALYDDLLDPKFLNVLGAPIPYYVKNTFRDIAQQRKAGTAKTSRRFNEELGFYEYVEDDQVIGTYDDWWRVTLFCYAMGFPSSVSGRVAKIMTAEELRAIMRSDPYRLLDFFGEGLTFIQVDLAVRRLGLLKKFQKQRAQAIFIYAFHLIQEKGSTYVPLGDFAKIMKNFESDGVIADFEFKMAEFSSNLKELVKRGVFVYQKDKDRLYLKALYDLENEVAREITTFKQREGLILDTSDLEKFIEGYQTAELGGGTLGEQQREAIKNALANKISMIMGLPGTGKTEVTKFLTRYFQSKGMQVELFTPTGMATKKLRQIMPNCNSGTIHRKLGYRDGGWSYNKEDPFIADVYLLDEYSMVGLRTFAAFMRALNPRGLLILVGDDEQLPSVEIGRCIRDLKESGEVPFVKMTQIYRQAEKSKIIKLAHDISAGRKLDLKSEADLRFFQCDSQEKVLESIRTIAKQCAESETPLQILSPSKKTDIGTSNLNTVVSEDLNDNPSYYKYPGRRVIRVDDRIINVSNNYQHSVYNGDTGYALYIDSSDGSLTVSIDGMDDPITFARSEVPEHIELGYALTVHKAQGQEYPFVVLVIHPLYDNRLLIKNLVYTAVTRSKKLLFIIGDEATFRQAAKTTQEDRLTSLDEAIRDKRFEYDTDSKPEEKSGKRHGDLRRGEEERQEDTIKERDI